MPYYPPEAVAVMPNMLPPVDTAVTVGTAFQPNATALTFLRLTFGLGGALALNTLVTVTMGPAAVTATQEIGRMTLAAALASSVQDYFFSVIPAGYYVLVTATGGASVLAGLTVTKGVTNFAP